ncbi:crotonase/enoyl-CoA hydratase family protein [Nocardioides sp. GCM10030258]|uniref:crotonase/enoyl-CoA hydratase family protein n=1 Tax=unclassified Nocardioides TaxID=2615069 RepID=UPI003620B3EA
MRTVNSTVARANDQPTTEGTVDMKSTPADESTGRAVVLDRRGPVALITLNRPDAMNAVNADVSRALGAALAEFAGDRQLRVAVVTGAGRAFCAGADLKELGAGRTVLDVDHPERGFAGFVRHFVDKPIIAAVNGFALGGGTEIVLAADMAVMSDAAKLGLPEVKRGLVAAAGGLLRLHRQIPPKVAAEAIFTGEPLDAATALQWGLVNRVVPAEEVLATALALAEKIAANAPLAVQTSKRIMMRSAVGSDWESPLWEMNEAEFRAVGASEDALEGANAFAQKREPIWVGA